MMFNHGLLDHKAVFSSLYMWCRHECVVVKSSLQSPFHFSALIRSSVCIALQQWNPFPGCAYASLVLSTQHLCTYSSFPFLLAEFCQHLRHVIQFFPTAVLQHICFLISSLLSLPLLASP